MEYAKPYSTPKELFADIISIFFYIVIYLSCSERIFTAYSMIVLVLVIDIQNHKCLSFTVQVTRIAKLLKKDIHKNRFL